MPPLSVLDLAPIAQGSSPAEALQRSRLLAQHVEKLGYQRFWLAEHHNMIGIASAATAVAIGYVAEATSTIRVGAGGIMLPNHSPLVVAEQFGTLASLYPERIDLGLGRAPGTDQRTFMALRRDPRASDDFANDVVELQSLLGPLQPGQRIQAIPGTDTNVPLWILGSSLFGAQLAAMLGLPYAFASHFAPLALIQALATYRERYQSSKANPKPYAAVGIQAIVADTDDEARFLFTTTQQQFANMIRGTRGRVPPPIPNIDDFWSPQERTQVESMLACAFVGSPQSVRRQLEDFVAKTQADELIVVANIFDFEARKRSYELLAEALNNIRGDE